MPIERAVPRTCCLAASRSLALRSGILILAISSTWASVIVPTVTLPGVLEALARPAFSRMQHRRRRRLEDERERAVLEDGDLDRDDGADLGLGRGVVGLDEVHDGDAVRAERGADGRRRGGLAGRDLDLDDRRDSLLCHAVVSLIRMFAAIVSV